MASDCEVSCTNDPNFAVIFSFLKVFGKLCMIEIPTIVELQQLIENTQEVLDPLKELHLKLLRRALKSVQSNRWERCLIKFCHQTGHRQEAWEIERFTYKKASTPIKLKVLRMLLEYQFTSHIKFKNAVNALTSADLRLNPVGRDKDGHVYWLQVDRDANLRLYCENQDEETWHLIARDREEFVKVLNMLKNGDNHNPTQKSTLNEGPTGADPPTIIEVRKSDDDSNEEFLSPESESDIESELITASNIDSNISKINTNETNTNLNTVDLTLEEPSNSSLIETSELKLENNTNVTDISPTRIVIDTTPKELPVIQHLIDSEVISISPEIEEDVIIITGDGDGADCESGYIIGEEICDPVIYIWGDGSGTDCQTGSIDENDGLSKSEENRNGRENNTAQKQLSEKESKKNNNRDGSDEGDTKSNTPGNTKRKNKLKLTQDNSGAVDTQITKRFLRKKSNDGQETSKAETTSKKHCDWNTETGQKPESRNKLHKTTATSKKENRLVKRQQSEDNTKEKDTTQAVPEEENNVRAKRVSTNDKVDSNSSKQIKTKSKVEATSKKNPEIKNKVIEQTPVEANILHIGKRIQLNRSKSLISEKRKSSVSSLDDDVSNKAPEVRRRRTVKKSGLKKQTKNIKSKKGTSNDLPLSKPEAETLPPKKLRLEGSNEECDSEISNKPTKPLQKKDKKQTAKANVQPNDLNSSVVESTDDNQTTIPVEEAVVKPSENTEIYRVDCNAVEEGENNACNNVQPEEQNDISPRKSLRKISRRKYKKQIVVTPLQENPKDPLADTDSDKNLDELVSKEKEVNENENEKVNITVKKSLKRGLLGARKRSHNHSESLSDEENEELQVGKRLKIKPKKINLSSRKKTEEKINNKVSSEESEDVEKVVKKERKKKRKGSSKKLVEESTDTVEKKNKAGVAGKVNPKDDAGDDSSPVRQSRRIAQLKIREEAERRQLEEVALRELKQKHKKKVREGDEEWHASGESSNGEGRGGRRGARGWRQSMSTAPPSDSESDEPLFEPEHEEPDLDYTKSDHEFSPESDLESEAVVEPVRRARTLKERANAEEDGFCARCCSGEQPEWILLCDICDAGYHASCLKPVLFLVPEGDWYCPSCEHARLVKALETELLTYDALLEVVQKERSKIKIEQVAADKLQEEEKAMVQEDKKPPDDIQKVDSSSDWSSSDEEDNVYRLRERRQLPVSYRSREYDRLMSSAIKEEYVEKPSTAGNQGRGKDISTIIEAAEEEKHQAEMAALEQGGPVVERKARRRPRRKPHKLNSLEVPSEDDNDTDEDFKETGHESTSEDISTDAERRSGSDSRSSDSLPIARRSGRAHKKDRRKLVESPELKKKKGLFNDTSSESSGTKDWSALAKKKHMPKKPHDPSAPKKVKRKKGLKQYDAEGNVIKARVKYGGLSGSEGSNDWSPKHRTRQKKINYTEMPNTESEEEMHKPSGKHMPDSSDEFRLDDSDQDSDWDSDLVRKRAAEAGDLGTMEDGKVQALHDLIKKTAVVPLEKLSEEVTKAKTEALEATLSAQAKLRASGAGSTPNRPLRGKGSRGGRGSRGPRGGGHSSGGGKSRHSSGSAVPHNTSSEATDEALSKLVGVKIKDLSQNTEGLIKPNQAEREKKRLEREARLAEKEARKQERIKKKEEKDMLKELKAKEREEKKQARIALQESKRQKKEKVEGLPLPIAIGGSYGGPGMRPDMQRMPNIPFQRMPVQHAERFQGEQRYPAAPRLQVRPELSAMRPDLANVRAQRPHQAPGQHPHMMGDRRPSEPPMREGTLSVAGSPQPFKPTSDAPSIITRMPHMMAQQYRGPVMYGAGGPYGHPRGPPQHMYQLHQQHPRDPSSSMGQQVAGRHPYPGQGGYYPQVRGYPPGYPPPSQQAPPAQQQPAQPPPSQPPIRLQPPQAREELPKIKSEIKSEPEYLRDAISPSSSPANRSSPPKEDVPRTVHPKIKHTENKDRRPRYPLGPYAPQYGPYGPYAPPVSSASQGEHYPSQMHSMQPPIRSMSASPSSGQLQMTSQAHHIRPQAGHRQLAPSSPHQPNSVPISVHQTQSGLQRPPQPSSIHMDSQSRSHHMMNTATTHHPVSHHSNIHRPSLHPPPHYTAPPTAYHHSNQNSAPHHLMTPPRSHHAPSPGTPSHHTASPTTSHHLASQAMSQHTASAARHTLNKANPGQSVHSVDGSMAPPLRTHQSPGPPNQRIQMHSAMPPHLQGSPVANNLNSGGGDTGHHPPKNFGPPSSTSIGSIQQNRLSSPPMTNLQRMQPGPGPRRPGQNMDRESAENAGHSRPMMASRTAPRGSDLTVMESAGPKPTSLVKPKLNDNASISLVNVPVRHMEEIPHSPAREESHGHPATCSSRDEEGSVFGGLVSYFSSQREDDIDG